MNETKKNKEEKNGRCWLVIIMILCAIILLFHCIDVSALCSRKCAEWGNFIGGVFGTIIAGIACIYVYKTYISQKKELEKTNKTAKKQQFETTFFNLIRIHKECLEDVQCTVYNLKQFVIDDDNKGERIDELMEGYRNQTLTSEEYDIYFDAIQLQGKQAMHSEFRILREKKAELYEKYFFSNWFNSICLMLKYLKDNEGDQFYVDFFYAQIAKPEWWVLYDIFLYGKEFISDKVAFDNFTDLVETELIEGKKMFDYGIGYISEEYTITPDNLYDKNFNHKKL